MRSRSEIQTAAQASLGILQSPLGERATVPTFGPSGRQERLNCWEKISVKLLQPLQDCFIVITSSKRFLRDPVDLGWLVPET